MSKQCTEFGPTDSTICKAFVSVLTIEQQLAHFSCKRPDSKYSRQGLCCNYSTLPLQWDSSHRQGLNNPEELCFHHTLSMDSEFESYNFQLSINTVYLSFFQAFKNGITTFILSSLVVQNRWRARFGLAP